MNKQQIIEYIDHPELLGEGNFSDLKLLSEKFPYSGLIQTLYAKALHNDNSIFFEEQLKKTAVTNANRKKLYQIIHQPKLQKIIEKVEEEVLNTPVEVIEKITEESSLNQETTTESKPIQEIKPSLEKLENTKELDELERNILTEAINSSMHLDVSDELPLLEDLTKPEENKPAPKIEAPEKEEKSSFTSWFSNDSQTKEKRKDISGLVEGFITKNKDKQEKKEFFSPTNLAKMSLVDNEDFVTETLAKVYAAQGNFDKAIRIYERLMLNYPEKKTFFASRIRFLIDKKENKKD